MSKPALPRPCLLIFLVLLFSASTAFSQQHPDDFFNKKIGGDGVLIGYADITAYLRQLEQGSGRILVRNEGRSTLGKPMILAIISSEKNIQKLDHLTRLNQKLSRPDRLTPGERDALIEEARLFILITGTLHATEVASAQMMLPLSHHLATTQAPTDLEILDRTVLLLMPSINPDGHDMVTDWYHKTRGTKQEGAPMPYLYHPYAGHDNNRDYVMLHLAESRVVNAVLHHRYFPHIFLDMHQMGETGPRMFVPPFKDPLNHNIDPLLIREVDAIGSHMALRLQQAGKKGVASAYGFDAYWPGGSKNTAWYKNVVGLLTELASANIASPVHIDANELNVRAKGLPEYKIQVNFPDPWPGGWWRLGDIIDYGRIAVEALLETGSQNRRLYIENHVSMGLGAMALPTETGLYGFRIPLDGQWDPSSTRELVNLMLSHGVDVYGDESGYLLPLGQPYGRFIKTVMELQRYPSVKDGVDGDVVEPYDVAGWTLPLQMGVWAESVTSPVDLTTLKQISAQDLIPPSTSMLTPGRYLLSGRDNAAWFLINGALGRKDTPLPHRVTERAATAEVGDFVVTVNNTNRDALAKLMTTHGLRLKETDASVLKTRPMKKKRIGLYQSDIPNMDEGWTRWVLDHYGFEYRVLKNEDFKSRDLTRECDVILMPSMKRDAIKDGFNQGRYLSMAASIPQGQLTGIGDAGLALLKSFVENGNTLVLLDAAWEIALKEFALPVSNQLEGLTSQDIFIPGSLIRVLLDNQDPLAWGMPRECALYLTQGPVFRTTPTDNPRIRRFGVGRFSDEGPHLLSGYAKGEKHLNRGLTALRFNWERGNVVLLAGRVQHRSQTTATFKLLFNALFL